MSCSCQAVKQQFSQALHRDFSQSMSAVLLLPSSAFLMVVIPLVSQWGIILAVLVGEAVSSTNPVLHAAAFSQLTQLGLLPVLSQDSWQCLTQCCVSLSSEPSTVC